MTLKEAIEEANSRPRNSNLQWYVCEWNDGYCINPSSYMKRFPDVKYVYSTEMLEKKENKSNEH